MKALIVAIALSSSLFAGDPLPGADASPLAQWLRKTGASERVSKGRDGSSVSCFTQGNCLATLSYNADSKLTSLVAAGPMDQGDWIATVAGMIFPASEVEVSAWVRKNAGKDTHTVSRDVFFIVGTSEGRMFIEIDKNSVDTPSGPRTK